MTAIRARTRAIRYKSTHFLSLGQCCALRLSPFGRTSNFLNRGMKPMAGSEPVREPELSPEAGEEQRRHIRKRVLWAAQLETSGKSCECFILNVSRSGAKLRLAAPMI